MDLVVAQVGSAHALKGEVTLELRTDVPEERIYPGATLRTDPEKAGPLHVQGVRVHKSRLLVQFEEARDRDAAEALRGVKLVIDSTDVEDEEDAWYVHELRGKQVQTLNGQARGVVKDFIPSYAHDLLVVDYKGREVLVPFVEEIVPEVDEEQGIVFVDPPGGLFEPDLTADEQADEQASSHD